MMAVCNKLTCKIAKTMHMHDDDECEESVEDHE